MFTKFASLEVLEVKSSARRRTAASLRKFADYNDYRTEDGYMYVRVRAISSRVNKNHDGWPSEELKKAYRSFVGKPIFVDHHNTDPKKARGVIVDAALHIEDTKTSGLDAYYAHAPANHLPPTWIELLLEVDAKKFPKLAKAIVDGDIDGVSMGANVELSKCSHCGNEARSPEQYCKHVASKGAFFDYYENGKKTSKRSYEDCYDIGFFEISFVFDPADETALVSDMKYAKKMERIAAIRTEAGEIYDYEQDPGFPGHSVAVGDDEFGDYAAPNEDDAVLENRYQRLLQMGYSPEQAMEIAKQEFRGEGAGIDIHRLEDMIGQGATPDQAYGILAKTAKTACLCDGKDDTDCPECGPVKKTADRNPEPQSVMTTAPEKVDTLRQEQVCPICGSDMEDGVCEVCNYEEPPEGFDNPDLSKAKEVDQQIHQQDAQQAEQGMQGTPNDVEPMQGGSPTPMPSGAMPAMSSTSNEWGSVTVSSENTKISAAGGGRINTQERPVLPVTRQLSDKPLGTKVIQEAKTPVQSNTKDTMTDNTKTADGPKPLDNKVQPEKRVDVVGVGGVDSDVAAEKSVDVEGVGAVSGDPLSGIEHQNVETDTDPGAGPATDTWSGNEGDSLGQHEPVTNETGDLFTVSSEKTANKYIKKDGDEWVIIQKGTGKVLSRHDSEEKANASFRAMEMHKHEGAAEDANDVGGPIGESAGNSGSDKEGGPTWDTSDAGFPDHKPSRVDLNAPLKEEVGEGTKTDSNEQYRSLKHTEPVTRENANELGGPIGVAVASALENQRLAYRVVKAELEMGLLDSENEFNRLAELETQSADTLTAQLETLSKVKTAGLKKATPQQKVAGRVPSFKPVTASFEIEAHGVSDAELEDSLW